MYSRKFAGKKSSLAGLLFLLLCGPGLSALAQEPPPEIPVDVSGAVTLELSVAPVQTPIPALSWQFSSVNPRDIGFGSPGGTGSSTLNPIKIVRRMDNNSRAIMATNWGGYVDPMMKIQQGGLTIELGNAYVVSYVVDGASYGNEVAVEVFELDYHTIKFIFPDGTNTGWNRLTNCPLGGCP